MNRKQERRIREAQRVSVASLIRKAVLAAAEQPAETEWGIRYPAGLPGERVRNFGSEDGGHMARLLLPDVLKAYGDGTALVCRGIGPWTPAPETPHGEPGEEGR